ncbi:putative transcription factor AS2-LOB family [Lupinus albus]|uniref:Putative transcription factor AS2-LOB family n=1 Tax=Lupinus albus TaxID=3870 RepID=A0A6A4NEH9_LUPAL|nr:putative transcription factor AS2-LOB family [Lupinus albus]
MNVLDIELPEHQRCDAVSSMVYEANARVRDPVYGCVGAISSLQQQVDVLQTQLALAQAEVVHMRVRQSNQQHQQVTHAGANSSSENLYQSSMLLSSQTKSLFAMDMVVDQANMGHSLWSC